MTTLSLSAQSWSEHIHVDQFGYTPRMSKVAVISNPQTGYNASESFSPGNTYQVIDNSTGTVVYTGAPTQWQSGSTHGMSGDAGWWFDFTSVSTPGTYYILDVSNNVRSDLFDINNNVYNEILKVACRAFYYNRCNIAKAAPYAESNWVDGNNFNNPGQDTDCIDLNDQSNASRRKDLSGGWWDAGDNNKYVTFAEQPVHELLSAYESYPDAFPDNWNIPESGNGISDIVDEVDWEITWLEKMQESDGKVIIKMGNIDYSDNDLSPPSLNTDNRYYGPTCSSSTMAFAGMIAHAAIVYDGISGLTSRVPSLTQAAEDAWDAVIDDFNADILDYDCDDGTIKAGDADRGYTDQKESALIAAVYLFELTGNNDYNQYVVDHIYDAEYMQIGWWGPFKSAINEALLRYTTLSGADQTTADLIINSITPHVQGDWDGFYGFNENDLYRAFAPDYMYHWGSNNTLAKLGTMNISAVDYNIDPANADDLIQKAEEMVHYFHGVNPQNIVYLSNMGNFGAEYSANEIYHFWFRDGSVYDNAQTSTYGPAPGFVAGGANKDYTISWLSPPANQPPMKAYKDWNTSNPEESWQITEPAIYYQSAYIRLLAKFANSESILPVQLISFTAETDALDVRLDWSTAVEINTDYFSIERSADGQNWEAIATVQAAGDSNTQQDYSYDDISVWETFQSKLFYRLRIVDRDGSIQTSPIVTASPVLTAINHLNAPEVTIMPNPVQDELTITADHQNTPIEVLRYTIRDMQSRHYVQGDLGATNTATITVHDLPSGIYIIEIIANNYFAQHQFIKH